MYYYGKFNNKFCLGGVVSKDNVNILAGSGIIGKYFLFNETFGIP